MKLRCQLAVWRDNGWKAAPVLEFGVAMHNPGALIRHRAMPGHSEVDRLHLLKQMRKRSTHGEIFLATFDSHRCLPAKVARHRFNRRRIDNG